MTPPAPIGFVGLGNMGSALCANLVGAGFSVVAFDVAGSAERAPEGAAVADRIEEVSACRTVVLSLPDGDVCAAVVQSLLKHGQVTRLIDTSTIGITAARTLAVLAKQHGATYVDAPVSGGVAAAKARTITVMFGGSDEAYGDVATVLAGLSDRCVRVGGEVGMGQALKLANNFLAATTLAATSEALAFATSAGLDPGVVIAVLDVSSGRSGATNDKFPNQVLTERFAAGFANSLMAKDLGLYLSSATELDTPSELGTTVTDIWRRFCEAMPGVDFTRIYPFIASPT